MTPMKTVHCVGVLVVDALCGPLAGYPAPGRQPQVVAQSIRFMPGGGAANTASALAQMGLPVGVFSKVGGDLTGRFLLEELAGRGVDNSGVAVSAGESTPFTFVGIGPDGNRTFIHTPGANLTFGLADIDRDRLLKADFLFYQDLWVLPNLDGPGGASLLAEARTRGLTTLLDECWGLGPDRDKLETMLPHADYVVPSLEDLLAIYPGRSGPEMIRTLAERGATKVVLKMGSEGCLVWSGGAPTRVPSCATRIVDTTGAGDCFNAGFVAGLACGLTDVQAARLGSLAAAACIRHVGGATGIPRLEVLMEEVDSE